MDRPCAVATHEVHAVIGFSRDASLCIAAHDACAIDDIVRDQISKRIEVDILCMLGQEGDVGLVVGRHCLPTPNSKVAESGNHRMQNA